jgi:hypothetical protein
VGSEALPVRAAAAAGGGGGGGGGGGPAPAVVVVPKHPPPVPPRELFCQEGQVARVTRKPVDQDHQRPWILCSLIYCKERKKKLSLLG